MYYLTTKNKNRFKICRVSVQPKLKLLLLRRSVRTNLCLHHVYHVYPLQHLQTRNLLHAKYQQNNHGMKCFMRYLREKVYFIFIGKKVGLRFWPLCKISADYFSNPLFPIEIICEWLEFQPTKNRAVFFWDRPSYINVIKYFTFEFKIKGSIYYYFSNSREFWKILKLSRFLLKSSHTQ